MPRREDNAHTVDRVRIRPGVGPRATTTARRLARVAGQHLGPALDRALADVDDDLTVERVTVTFPADPDELDDEAVAMLWASLVRNSLERIRTTRHPPAVQVGSEYADRDDPDPQGPPPPDAQDLTTVVGALQRWARDGTAPTPTELELAVGRADLADRALTELPHSWRALVRQLLDQAAAAAPATTPGTAAPHPADAEPPPNSTARRGTRPAAPGQPAREANDTSVQPPAAQRPAHASYESPVRPPATQTGAARVAVSSWGGLVLLHYRLRPYLEQAADSESDFDPLEVRIAALALLLDEPGSAADPLVRLLAGDPDWSTSPDDPQPVPLRDRTAATARAELLLQDFAGDLPGFGRSSAGFVREQWVRRRARLLEDPPAVLLTLERRPLDLVLDRLPYPIGALRLPWTPPLFVGWERP